MPRTSTRTIAARNASARRRDPESTGVPRMGAYNGIFAPSFRFPPFQNDWFLEKVGWDRVDATLNLSSCRAPFNLLRYSVLGSGWRIVAGVTDPMDSRYTSSQQDAQALQWALSNIIDPETGQRQDFRNIVWEQMYAWWAGFLVTEIYPRYLDDGPFAGVFGFSGFGPKINKQIGFDTDPRTLGVRKITSYTPGSVPFSNLNRRDTVQGGYDFDIPLDCAILYTHNPIGNLPYGQGVWRPCYPHTMAADKALVQWVKALEQWGGINGVMKVPAGSESAALDAMMGARESGYMTVPPNSEFLLAGAPMGVFESYSLILKDQAAAIAEVVIGSALAIHQSSNPGLGAGGEADSQEDSTEVYKTGHQIGLENCLNQQLVLPWCRDNIPHFDPTYAPKLVLGDEKPADVLQIMQAFDLAIKDGVLWSGEKWIRDEMGWKQATPEEVKGLQAEKEAQQEAAERLADARNSGSQGKMTQDEAERTLANLAMLIAAARETGALAG